MDKPALVARIVFRHGRVFENGGWFDTARAKPKIQIKRAKHGEWEDAGRLESYPTIAAGYVPGLRDGEPFTFKLAEPTRVVAIRIAGRPARSFSSCAELAAYAR
jgi:hypothetical protein